MPKRSERVESEKLVDQSQNLPDLGLAAFEPGEPVMPHEVDDR